MYIHSCLSDLNDERLSSAYHIQDKINQPYEMVELSIQPIPKYQYQYQDGGNTNTNISMNFHTKTDTWMEFHTHTNTRRFVISIPISQIFWYRLHTTLGLEIFLSLVHFKFGDNKIFHHFNLFLIKPNLNTL